MRLHPSLARALGPPLLGALFAFGSACTTTGSPTCASDTECPSGSHCVAGGDGEGRCEPLPVADSGVVMASSTMDSSGVSGATSAAPSSGGSSTSILASSSSTSASGVSGGSSSAESGVSMVPWSGKPQVGTLETLPPFTTGGGGLKVQGKFVPNTPVKLRGHGLILRGRLVPTSSRSVTP